ncbi:hypothetical protein [Pedobacter sp. D749]|uniref:hypothetical protein n=1 Tax=Pedobacter sp. D749 TaxID=2856523 RepID=UPI001C58423A|nr:hypothetical protein [Pedobacter sp. D749]QXU43264.1 hypothetical protein KYH19_06670 [Pedobacter sp. D749]
MKKRNEVLSKFQADCLAQQLSSGNPTTSSEILIKQYFNGHQFPSSSDEKISNLQNDTEEERIGIWSLQNTVDKPTYVRDIKFYNEWHLWANASMINLLKEKNRIVLLGESVARGYFYDPYYNPAKALEKFLCDQDIYPASEIIDLARTSLDLTGLYDIFNSCIKLQPDVVIIFAGNNWWTELGGSIMDYLSNQVDRQSQPSVEAVKEYLEGELKKRVEEFIDDTVAKAKAHKFRIVFVIPEFNLLDWKSTKSEQIISRLDCDNTSVWVQKKIEAEQALRNGDYVQLEAFSQGLIALDKTHPIGYELLATSAINLGNFDLARKALEDARDTAIVFRSSSKPRIFSTIKHTILAKAESYPSLEVVDSLDVLTPGAKVLPNRDIFLDYCHLTIKGIDLTMQAVAKLLTGVDKYNCGYPEMQLPEHVVPMAHLFAAIHNAHLGQNDEIVTDHCLKAVKSAKVRKFMPLYIDMSTRRLQSILCNSFEQIIINGDLEQYQKGTELLHAPNNKKLDLILVDAMISALKTFGLDLEKSTSELRIAEHGLITEINLLESFYLLDEHSPPVVMERAFYQARQLESNFLMVISNVRQVELNLITRTTNDNYSSNNLELCLNGQLMASFSLTKDWAHHKILLSPDALSTGNNVLSIKWPIANDSFSSLLINKRSLKTVDDYFNAMFHVFGEIQTFTATISED